MRFQRWVVAGMVTVGLSAGCGATSASSSAPVGSGYLATAQDEVDFLQWTTTAGQWTTTAGQVQGTFTFNSLIGSPPGETVRTLSGAVSGTIDSGRIILSLNLGQDMFGTYSGPHFTLDVPQPDGSMKPYDFTRQPTSAYNVALAQLRTTLRTSNQVAAAQQQQREEQTALLNAEDSVERDEQALTTAEAGVGSAVGGFATTLAGANADVAKAAEGEATVIAEASTEPSYEVCGDAATVSGDYDTVTGDAASVGGDADTFNSAVSGVTTAVRDLEGDLGALEQAETNDPGYVSGASSQTAVDQTITAASAAVRSDVAQAHAAITEANTDDQRADDLASKALAAGSCGSASAFTPLTTIPSP